VSGATIVALPLAFVTACAVLGAAAWRRRVPASKLGARSGEWRARWLLDTVAASLDASRCSSEAVLEALNHAFRAFDAGVDSVLVFTATGDELACVYASGARVEHFRRFILRRDDPLHLPARAAEAGCRAVLPVDGAALLPTDRYAIAVPMLDGRRLLAVAYVSSTQPLGPPLDDAIAQAIQHAAAPYAIALEREADRADAMHDGLTGLLSPRAFRQYLRDEVARAVAARRHRILCLWFVDTDRFKEVNDRFGHRAGDAVLQAMAALLELHLIADVDVAARNGGDEFCALLRGASKGRAIERAQAFCDAVRRHDFGLPLRITASVGIATYPHDASTASSLLETADAAMYHSKHNGRDRVSFAVAPGAFASLRSEAGSELSRTPSRCRSDFGESFAERSSP
jgi:diguanylate cyclase (GGDEF)-like protein